MPGMQRVVSAINRFGEAHVIQEASAELVEEVFRQGRGVIDIAEQVLGDMTADEKTYFAQWPTALSEAVRASMRDAALRGQRVQVQWVPSYDFEVRIWEPRSEGSSAGGLVIQFCSPYPSDVVSRLG